MTAERVLVTGASGFVGTALCERLRQDGRHVIAVGRRPPPRHYDEFRHWDLAARVSGSLLDGVDTVLHLAGRAHAVAESASDAKLYDVVNRDATVRLVASALDAEVRAFVFVSSCKAVPPGPEARRDPYGASKWLAERAVVAASTEIHAAVIRPALVYGPGCKGNLLGLMRAVDKGRLPALPNVPNRRSLVGLDDLVNAITLVAQDHRGTGKSFTVTDGEVYSTKRIIDALVAALGAPGPRGPTLPIWALRGAAMVGDVAQLFLRRRMPMNTSVLNKLLGSAEYPLDPEIELLGYVPTQTLEMAAPGMAAHYRRVREV